MIKMRLVRLLSHAKKYVIYQILWQWISLIAQVVSVFFITGLIEDAIYQTSQVQNVLKTGAILVLCIVIRYLCDRLYTDAGYRASVDVKRVLREQIYQKLLRLGSGYHEQIATSTVVQMSGEGVEQLETYFGKYLSQFFYSLLAPVTLCIILSITVSRKVSVLLLVFVPLIPLSIVVVQKIAKRLLNKYWGAYASLGDSFLENLQGLTTLKIYHADEEKSKEMDKESEHFRKITMKVLTMQLNSTSVMDIMAYGGAAIGIYIAVHEYMNGAIADLSGVLRIVLLAVEFFLPLRILGSYFHIAMNGMAASDRIFEFLDLPEPNWEDAVSLGEEDTWGIQFRQVSFSYTEDRSVIQGIDLSIEPGELVSLVGKSGCGKSTLAALLVGRNRGYEGSIRIGDKEVCKIEEASRMKHITVVSHNSYLFKGTVEENLRMAKTDATEQEMKEVLMRCNLWEFLESREGLHTELNEKASNLSGGQCQRLALARALLHDSEIYIFDEATSNIDAESEQMIMKVIEGLRKKKTILLISHRLSNVIHSDCIYMLEDGKIVEQGNHEELLAQGRSYSHLYESQRRLESYAKG